MFLSKHRDSIEIKTNFFPEGTDIKCFFIHPGDDQSKKKKQQQRKTNKHISVNNSTTLFLLNTANVRQIHRKIGGISLNRSNLDRLYASGLN